MMSRSRLSALVLPLLILFLGAGCSTAPVRDIGIDKLSLRKAEQELSHGIKNYEEGNYKTASKSLQNALDAKLAFDSDAVQAHKYLAFIHCLSNREKQCRDEFRRAFELDSKFDLAPAEAGHPIWGPIFRSVKAETQGSRKK
jgi:Tfp pilus assembly protein PilF